MASSAESDEYERSPSHDHHLRTSVQQRHDISPSRSSFSSSLNQKTPARSYFQHTLQESQGPIDITHKSAQDVREDTAELASWALSDIAFRRSEQSPQRYDASATTRHKSDSYLGGRLELDDSSHRGSSISLRPDVIEEVSEPTSPQSLSPSQELRPHSALTDMIKSFPITENDSQDTDDEDYFATNGVHPVIVRQGIISQPNERTPMLRKRTAYGSVKDLESQKTSGDRQASRLSMKVRDYRAGISRIVRVVTTPKSWNREDIWLYGFRQPASLVPSVVLGLLLNILDALSYGMILFPLGNSVFEGLGADGISIFYVSCIISQLTFSLGGSIFKGGVGSEMIEVVPFFHKMAFIILAQISQQNLDADEYAAAVRATTVVAYSLSSVVTGLVFCIMGQLKLGYLIGFFPRHILLGCIGGVGLFLVVTGLEVSARLDGNLDYNLATVQKLILPNILPLWIVPLILALMLFIAKRRFKHSLTDATYFLSIFAVFWFFAESLPSVSTPDLRTRGWLFEAPEDNKPFYNFYSFFQFRLVDWRAVGQTVPAMFALTFFGILHVPINIPALALSTGEDNVDLDRELRAHGISNVLSGFCGSIQNYLVYTNTLLFVRSGGGSRVAGVMLAAATFGILVVGPVIIGYIPIMVVGSLIFFLGFDLMREALVDTWGKMKRLEYLTIIIIVITMVLWDFVGGIFIGIVLACFSYVIQTSQVSAIRGKLYGGIANSTVRRHPIQHRYLEEAGKQVHVMKLAGYLFFGTIAGVEDQIRMSLGESFQKQPIRFLVLDFYNVDGVDYSAAEAFKRIGRILLAQDIQLIICGVSPDGIVGRGLRNVGLMDNGDGAMYFQSLNSALEYCENELLKILYKQRNFEAETESSPAFIEVPKSEDRNTRGFQDLMYSSPRRDHLHQVATKTLCQQDPAPPSKWQHYTQPLKLILQTFSTVSDQPEEFWYRTAQFFTRKIYRAETVLFEAGDRADGFYLLESGIIKAKYDYPQGNYSELIVAGTCCGELPFFSATERTATAFAQRDCITWMLDTETWQSLQKKEPDVAQELLKISLKLTSERMDTVTKYMLLTSG